MAREHQIWIKRKFRQSGLPNENPDPYYKAADISGNNHVSGLIAVPTTATELPQIANLGTVGLMWLENRDATNFVVIGAGDAWTATGAPIKLLAGEAAPLRWSGAQKVSASADTGTVNLYYEMREA